MEAVSGSVINPHGCTYSGILILLDLQVVGSSGDGSLLPNIPKCQCLIIAYNQSIDIGVLSLREPERDPSVSKITMFREYPHRRFQPSHNYPAPLQERITWL